MIYYTKNMFMTKAQTLVCPVNVVGVMGNGLAKYFSLRYPGLLQAYKKACSDHHFTKEGLFLFNILNPKQAATKVLCFPSKTHWKNPSTLEDIEQGFIDLVARYEAYGITSLAMPLVGCGKGGLDPSDVIPLIEHYLSPLPIEVYISTGG